MAGGLAKPAGRRRGRRSARRSRLSDINVTPFVDVMLVLLIIFMVTAPLLTVSVPVDLPQTAAKTNSSDTNPLSITIQSDGTVYLQDTKVEIDALVTQLRAISHEGYDRQIYVRGDTHAQYGVIADVLARISSSGFHKLQLVTDTNDHPQRRSDGQ